MRSPIKPAPRVLWMLGSTIVRDRQGKGMKRDPLVQRRTRCLRKRRGGAQSHASPCREIQKYDALG